MDRFIPPEKRSKKEQKKLNAKRRRTWGEMSPVTRTVPNGKAYDRKKQKNDDRRSSRNFREEGPAVFMSRTALLLPAVSISAGHGHFCLPGAFSAGWGIFRRTAISLLKTPALPAILIRDKILRKARCE